MKMLIFKVFIQVALLISLAFSLYTFYVDRDISSINTEVYSISLSTGEMNRVGTLDEPVITANTIAEELKFNFVDLNSFRLEDIDGHIEKFKPLFSPSYFSEYKSNAVGRAKSLIKDNVRIVDTIITEGPVFIGGYNTNNRSWVFYIKGYLSYKGLFRTGKDRAINQRREYFVFMEEGESLSSNLSGLKITSIKEL